MLVTIIKNIEAFHTKIGCKMLYKGQIVMEGILKGMMYRFIIKVVLQTTRACVANNLGLNSYGDGNHNLKFSTIGWGIYIMMTWS